MEAIFRIAQTVESEGIILRGVFQKRNFAKLISTVQLRDPNMPKENENFNLIQQKRIMTLMLLHVEPRLVEI